MTTAAEEIQKWRPDNSNLACRRNINLLYLFYIQNK